MRKRIPPEQRFWSKVDRCSPDECWPWTGSRDVRGYGQLYAGRDDKGMNLLLKAHRLSWEMANQQPIPPDLFVLHACDNPPCVNPRHLRVGTIQDNIADREARRRGRSHRGTANNNARLTEAQVREILVELQRLPRRSQAAIAADFGIKQAQVSRIMRQQSWPHLFEE